MSQERSDQDLSKNARLLAGVGERAKAASAIVARASSQQKDEALLLAADAIDARRADILLINSDEMKAGEANGLAKAFLDRMLLTDDRIDGICQALRDIAGQNDPVGEVIEAWDRPNGLKIERVRSPIGVVGIIYESRPNVTVDAAAICLKAGSAAILRGGSDCLRTAQALHAGFVKGMVKAGLPADAVQIVETADRAAVGELLSGLDGAVDMVIPRGGKSLVARVQNEARVPVLSHLDGVCHVYVDAAANPDKARDIAVNAKMRRAGICGAMETLLIDRSIANDVGPNILSALLEEGCELRGDPDICALNESVTPASADDWGTEYLDTILTVGVVDGVDGAIEHISKHGSGHTDAIVTEDHATAERFLSKVDSAIVMLNASTQFADGGEFGLGAEIGIATGKLHARGPVGVRELTTYRNLVRSDFAVRP
ncbi:MAG: glutamate-5-semialdehyde dehydrogenase [Pseudomonadota bacterium]